jgi:hypothetical protein
VLALATTAGCGTDEPAASKADAGGAAKAKETPSASAAPKATMVQTCPKVETAMKRAHADDWLPIPSPRQADQMMTSLHALAEAGDEETRNALTLMRDPIDALVAKYPSPGEEMTDAWGALLAGIDGFAKRCKAAGSSALQ